MNPEPNHSPKDPNQTIPCCQPARTGDEFDKFLRVTGGDPAPRGGHAASVASFEAKIAIPEKKEDGEYYYGPAGILPAVYKRDDPMECCGISVPQPITTRRRKR